MEKLNFFTVDPAYVQFLKAAETEERGFARVPNMEDNRYGKAKFLLGVVLTVNGTDYYVPVTAAERATIRTTSGLTFWSRSFLAKFAVW